MKITKVQVEWVRAALNKAYEELGTWQKVADVMADSRLGKYALMRSKSHWMQLADARKVTFTKANTVRAYYGLAPWVSERTGIPCRISTRDALLESKQPDETWDDYLMRTRPT